MTIGLAGHGLSAGLGADGEIGCLLSSLSGSIVDLPYLLIDSRLHHRVLR
jgi:hypothetical protein